MTTTLTPSVLFWSLHLYFQRVVRFIAAFFVWCVLIFVIFTCLRQWHFKRINTIYGSYKIVFLRDKWSVNMKLPLGIEPVKLASIQDCDACPYAVEKISCLASNSSSSCIASESLSFPTFFFPVSYWLLVWWKPDEFILKESKLWQRPCRVILIKNIMVWITFFINYVINRSKQLYVSITTE